MNGEPPQSTQDSGQNSPENTAPNPDDEAQYLGVTDVPPSKPSLVSKLPDFKKLLIIPAIIIGLVVIVASGYAVYNFIIRQAEQITVIPEDPTTDENGQNVVPQHPEEPTRWETYTSQEYRFSFRYPEGQDVVVYDPFDLDPVSFSVIAVGPDQDVKPVIENADLNDGYIFRVIVHKNVINRDISDLTKKKHDSYFLNCPGRSRISNIEQRTVSGFEAQIFTVENCRQDYKETFVLREDTVYEIIQVYQGNLGYIQVYESITDQMRDSFQFTNLRGPTAPNQWIQVTNTADGYRFSHPQLDADCCDLPNLPYGDNEKTAVLAVPETVIEGSDRPFDGFAIFVTEMKPGETFEAFSTQMKQALIEEYRIITGRNPQNTEEQNITVDGRSAILLKGYLWYGNGEVILIDSPKPDLSLVITKTEASADTFDDTFSQIIDSFILFADSTELKQREGS